jgi:hypothetical protein
MWYDDFDLIQVQFHDLDRRLQAVLVGWVVSFTAFLVGLRLLTANATMLSLIR